MAKTALFSAVFHINMRFQNQLLFSTLPSTNTYLKENYRNLPNYTVAIAKHQTAGRGRMDRIWVDGDDLLLSVLIKDSLEPNKIPQLALVAAAAVWKTLAPYLAVEIKWPNDIVYRDRKISGILIESVIISTTLAALIIGIGINVNTKKFPEELFQKATSLTLVTKEEYDQKKLKDDLLYNLDYYYQDFLTSGNEYLKICRENSLLLGKEVVIDDFRNPKSALVLDILESGNILLEVEGKKREYSSGEISLKEFYNTEVK